MPAGRGLFEVSQEKMRTLHLAFRTERAYLHWIRRYVNFHNRRHPREMGAPEVEAFLTHLAVDAHVSASTQNQALQALLFLYRCVLETDLPWLRNVTRARRSMRRLRVKDVVMERAELIVRDAKGGRDRVTVLPTSITQQLRVHLEKLHLRFNQQLASGNPGVSLPSSLAQKFPHYSKQWGWQYVFPATSLREDVYS